MAARFDIEPPQPVADWLSDLPQADDDADYLLRVDDDGISLQETRRSRTRPLRVNFDSAELRRRRLGSAQALHRAVGARRGRRPDIIDATAGFGGDAFLLAASGCRLTLMERRPVVAALLWDGLRRAAAAGGELARIAARMQLRTVDARQALKTAEPVAVVYLDPMFPIAAKSAMNRRQMRLLAALAGDDDDAGDVLDEALHLATERVVVKRRRLAESLGDADPNYQIKGRSLRFDVYLAVK